MARQPRAHALENRVRRERALVGPSCGCLSSSSGAVVPSLPPNVRPSVASAPRGALPCPASLPPSVPVGPVRRLPPARCSFPVGVGPLLRVEVGLDADAAILFPFHDVLSEPRSVAPSLRRLARRGFSFQLCVRLNRGSVTVGILSWAARPGFSRSSRRTTQPFRFGQVWGVERCGRLWPKGDGGGCDWASRNALRFRWRFRC